jgi:GTPase SAR1 family protein
MENEYKRMHEERKEKVLSLLDMAQNHFLKYKDEDKAEAFKSLYANVNNGNFSIVVVGEFSAGKSTFLNALMGEKYLPSFTTETTATVNFLKHKEFSKNGNGISVVFKDGKVEECGEANLKNIEKYVSTRSDVDVAKDIEYVELYLDSKFLKDGVTLVDSPGLNGVMEGHEEITQRQIEKSHACIFMFSADQPGRKTDYEFLAQLKSKVKTIIFVLNRIDEIKSSEGLEVEDVIGSLKESYSKHFQGEPIPEIWPIAAYPALVSRSGYPLDYHGKVQHSEEEKAHYFEKSRINKFENRLWKFLTQGEKAKEELLAPVDRVKKIIQNQKQELNKRIEELQGVTDTQEINLEICSLEDETKNLENSLQDKYEEITSEIDGITRELKENLKGSTLKISDKYVKQVEDWTDLDNITKDLEKFNNRIQKEYTNMTEGIFEEFIENFADIVKLKYKQYFSEFEKSVEGIEKNVDIDLGKSLNYEDFDINFGLQDYKAKIAEFEKEMNKLEEDIDNAGAERIKAQILMNQKEILEEKMQSVAKRAESFEAILGPRPSVRKTTRTEMKKQWRGGIIGTPIDIIFGRKVVPKEVVVDDNSEQVNYDEQKTKIEKKFSNEEAQLKQELKGIKNPDKHPEEYDALERKLEKIKIKKEEELNSFRNTYKAEFQKKYNSTLRNIKNEISDFIDEAEAVVEKAIIKKINSQKKQLSEIVVDIISKNVQENIERKKSELELRKQQLEASVEEKESFIKLYTEEIEGADAILMEAVQLSTELEMLEVDVIKQE